MSDSGGGTGAHLNYLVRDKSTHWDMREDNQPNRVPASFGAGMVSPEDDEADGEADEHDPEGGALQARDARDVRCVRGDQGDAEENGDAEQEEGDEKILPIVLAGHWNLLPKAGNWRLSE